uniref:Uncharacterized protein n=1 Tax=Onchocerca volvulus TaxID=6282 RepID=A0A8R1TSC4_ONCVO
MYIYICTSIPHTTIYIYMLMTFIVVKFGTQRKKHQSISSFFMYFDCLRFIPMILFVYMFEMLSILSILDGNGISCGRRIARANLCQEKFVYKGLFLST